MLHSAFPLSTPYDPSEDPPSSIDPLGTVATAEQLADVLFPGLTARMWRVRHLTFTALAAHIADRASAAEGEEFRLEARLGLERLFVSAIAWKEKKEDGWSQAARRLPGISLARRAIRSKHQPLGRQNFLKGQAINGPFGVVQRLARNLDIIDDDNRLARNGGSLLLAWSVEQQLAGILDDTGSNSQGAKWLRRLTRHVVDHVQHDKWPGTSWWGWSDLADTLRHDQPGREESRLLFQLLSSNSSAVRKRSIALLRDSDIVSTYRSHAGNGTRGELDRAILAQQIVLRVQGSNDKIDELIEYTVALIDAYEQVSGHLETAFRGLIWALTHRGGRCKVDELLKDAVLATHMDRTRRKLAGDAKRFQTKMSALADHPQVLDVVNQERLDQLMQDSFDCHANEQSLIDSVMVRHRRVQDQKRKGVWVEQEPPYWTLMPGFGDSTETPPKHSGAYSHPFRVSNAYSFLNDLGLVRGIEVPDGEEV